MSVAITKNKMAPKQTVIQISQDKEIVVLTNLANVFSDPGDICSRNRWISANSTRQDDPLLF